MSQFRNLPPVRAYLNPAQIEYLTACCNAEVRTVSAMLRYIVQDYMRRHPDPEVWQKQIEDAAVDSFMEQVRRRKANAVKGRRK